MKLLVCIKPDHTGQDLGPFEHLALEAALKLREDGEAAGLDPVQVEVITAGPESWQESLVRALGTGADRGIHLVTPQTGEGEVLVPASAVAGMLARAVGEGEYDLILTGVMSQDLMAGQTGPLLARQLGLPCATAVVSLEILGPDRLRARREMDGGMEETLEIPLPALVSIQSGVYTPRYPVLSHMLKARQKPIHTIETVIPDTPERFSPPALPRRSREGRQALGSLEDQVLALKSFLKQKGVL